MFNFYPISSKIILRINSKSHCLKKKKKIFDLKKKGGNLGVSRES